MSFTIQLIGMCDGSSTEHDDAYVVEYDPAMGGLDPDGMPWVHLVTTRERSQAKQFPDIESAMDYWRQPKGLRPDGKPDRPLTVYTVAIDRD